MIRKTYTADGRSCRVTFSLAPGTGVADAHVCGDFNGWNPSRHPLRRRRDGRLSTSLSLRTPRSYRFRYLLDGHRWENDPAADAYLPNPYGTEDSVVEV